MKNCKICSLAADVDTVTCPACGEATWSAPEVPAPKPRRVVETGDAPKKFRKRSR